MKGFAHTSYKESCIDWCPKIPEHWESTRTKYVTEFTTGWTPPTGDDEAYNGTNYWANISDLGPKVLENTAKTISDSAIAASRIKPSPQGSLLFSFKLSIGQVSLAGRKMYTNEAIATFVGSDKLAIPFAYHAFPVFLVQNASENIYGAKLLNQELIRAARFPLPPLGEQLAIASFLDHETAKIDALISEQQHLIDLLQEKRQAVISNAVTKGLNPNAPMKDSGVELLGEVPDHWDVLQVRRITKSHKQGYYSNEGYADDGINLLRITDIREDASIDITESPKVNETDAVKEFLLKEGDFVFARTGGAGSYGYIGNLPEATAFASYLIRFRFSQSANRDFLRLYFFAKCFLDGIGASIHGGVNQNVHAEDIKNQWIALPPLQEQGDIAGHVLNKTSEYQELVSLADSQIEVLQERRSALISAAVTGQIDIRGLANKEAAA